MSLEQAIRITAKLYEVRQTVKDLYGAEWKDRLQPYIDQVNRLQRATRKPILELTQELAREMQAQGHNPMMVLAATVEILEPSQA